MEEKETTVSGSVGGNSDTDSPPPISSHHHLVHPPHHHHYQVAMSVAPSPPVLNDVVVSSATDFAAKKKRGRPRKYDAEGNLRVKPPALFHHQPNNNSSAPPSQPQPQTGFYISHSLSTPPPTSTDHYGHHHQQQQQQRSLPASKRGRGRPSGSGNWQLLASLGELFANTAGGDFTPHVLTVNTGEDVAGKIMTLSQKGSRGICVLSANGAVSNVTIRQPSSSGGILTYEACFLNQFHATNLIISSESNLIVVTTVISTFFHFSLLQGRFEILSLTGSFTAAADHQHGGNSTRNRTGGLSVSLASSDGRVIGGGVAGLLLAASPIQMVVGSFTPNAYNKVQKRKYNREQQHPPSPAMSTQPANTAPAMAPTAQVSFVTQQAKPEGVGIVSPPPTTGSLPGQNSHSNAAGAGQTMFHHSMNHSHSHNHDHGGGWNGTMNLSSVHRPSPDINVSAPSDDDVPAVSGVF
ncbi:AT-hook motif nuclear-localized protein 1 [Linum grandiflorum]